MSDQNCIFCKIVAGEIPSTRVYEDENCIAFNDLQPQAPTHILVIPREHLDSLDKASDTQKDLLGHLMFAAAEISRENGFAANGYRVVINTNSDGGQTVFHLTPMRNRHLPTALRFWTKVKQTGRSMF